MRLARRETGLSPPVKFYLWFLLCIRARLHMLTDALFSLAGKGLTSWLSFVMSNCDPGSDVVLDCIDF